MAEATVIDAMLAGQQQGNYRYFCLHKDNLRDPDLFLVNALDNYALPALAQLNPGELRPALLVGRTADASPHPCIERPIRLAELLTALDDLAGKRAAALARLQAASQVMVPERRRRDRLAPGMEDPATYLRLRKPPAEGGVVVVDRNGDFAGHLGRMLARRNIAVGWQASELAVAQLCRQRKTGLVMINTSTPGIDPYRLCLRIKNSIDPRVRVIFLVGRRFEYVQARAELAGCDGFLNKPLSPAQLVSVLKKFLPAVA